MQDLQINLKVYAMKASVCFIIIKFVELKTKRSMKKFDFTKCRNEADIRMAILRALENDNLVLNDEEAEAFFREDGFDGEMTTRTIVSEQVSIWNEEMNGEEVYNVIVREHYIDSGSSDYFYSFDIINA